MRRPAPQETAGPGQDSFLDIVANIVGILIILVMVTGVRVRNAAVEAASIDAETQAEADALREEQATAGSLFSDVLKAEAQVENFKRERARREAERDRLAVVVAAWEHKIRSHRDQLDADSHAAYDLGLNVSEARLRLDALRRRRANVDAAQAPPILIESYPTPLSKVVDGDEIHFQLRNGRLAYIPMENLLGEFQEHARQKAYKLLKQPELTETIGPSGGFRFRYTLQRRTINKDLAAIGSHGGFYPIVKRWTLIPTSAELGEPVNAALAPVSEFRSTIARYDPDSTTVTIWTYPDSFAEFRRLKKELHHLGFPTAARPLPHGAPITGSPHGTKSAAE